MIPSLDLVAVGTGSWGHPSSEAFRLLAEADLASSDISGLETTTWEASSRGTTRLGERGRTVRATTHDPHRLRHRYHNSVTPER